MAAVRIVPTLTLAALSSASASVCGAQSVRLNGPLVQPDGGDVVDHAFSRSGAHVVWRADALEDEVFELFSTPRDGSEPALRLHAAFGSTPRDVLAFAPCAGERVVFVADLAADESYELFVAPLDASVDPLALSGTLVPGGDVSEFQLTPDGTRVVFLADRLLNDTPELFSVPTDGSAAPTRIDSSGSRTSLFRIAPNGTTVVYATGPGFSDENLWRAPLDGSAAPTFLANSGPQGFVSYTFFSGIAFSSDSLHAACTTVELFVDRGLCGEEYTNVLGLRLASGIAAPLNLAEYHCYTPPINVAGERVLFRENDGRLISVASDGTDRRTLANLAGEFVLTPDEAQVAFLAGAAGATSLLVAPVDGSSPAVAIAGPGTLASPRVSASSAVVTYVRTDPGTGFRGLFALSTGGGAPLLLNGPPVPGRGVLDHAHAPSGAVVYREDRHSSDAFELWSVDLSLSPRQLSVTPTEFRDVEAFTVAPDGAWVAHLGDVLVDERSDLFGTPIDAGTPRVRYGEIQGTGPVLGDVLDFVPTSDGYVVYRADELVDESFDLFVARGDGRGAPRRLTEPLTDAGDVQPLYLVTPDGARALFRHTLNGLTRLWSSPLAGGPAIALDDAASEYGGVVLTPDGSRVVYRRAFVELHSAPVDGHLPAHAITESVQGVIGEIRITAAGGDVLWRVSSSSGGRLLRAKVDGSDSPSELGPPLVVGRDVLSFVITSDSARAVLRVDAQTDEAFELYSTPTHGFGDVTKLNGALPGGGDVFEYLVTEDATRVVYRADQAINNRFELFVAPVAGGASTRLTPLPAGGRVEGDFRLSGPSAVYRADAAGNEVIELFVVALDGASAPVPLHPPLPATGDVTDFALSPDGSWLVYRADATTDEVFELHARSAIGGGPLTLATLSGTADVEGFLIAPDSQHVFFRADTRFDDTLELFRVPIDGSSAPLRVYTPLPVFADVYADFLPSGDGRVLYRLDRSSDGILELFHFLALDADRTLPASTPTVTKSIVR